MPAFSSAGTPFGGSAPTATNKPKTTSMNNVPTGTGYNPQQSFSYAGGPYGSQVSQVNLPNPSAALQSVLPGLTGTNQNLSTLINSELSGNISPSTMQQLQNTAANFGETSGMPFATAGNTLPLNNLLENVGITAEGQEAKGVSDYGNIIPTIAQTQTVNPELAYQANLQNAVSAAAPSPEAAAQEEQNLLNQYMQELQGPAAPAPPPQGSVHVSPGGAYLGGSEALYKYLYGGGAGAAA